MSGRDVLQDFGLSVELGDDVWQTVWGPDAASSKLTSSPAENLSKWLKLLPAAISAQIDLALNQERPFMPPDVTPEMMAEPNETMPSMNHIEIIYRCIDFALKAKNYIMAAALVYVVDRSAYRFGRSQALLRVVEDIENLSPDTPIAPQVILRQARVMKDSGDLHTAVRVLDGVISKERKWDYKSEEQYENTKAVCVQIKGQILHNLGLWKDAVEPLIQSVHSFTIVRDKKGISSSLGLLSRCLKKLGAEDYQDLQNRTIGVFLYPHPCYEAYVKGQEAVKLIEDLGTTLYLAHHQMVADESLLMFTIQQVDMTERQKLDQYQVIVKEMTQTLTCHRTVHHLHSLEAYLAFVRSVFMVSLTLAFSPVQQDADLARFLEKLSLELYSYMCQKSSSDYDPISVTLTQSSHSVRLMNSALALLGLSALEGSSDLEEKNVEKKWSEVEKKEKKIEEKEKKGEEKEKKENEGEKRKDGSVKQNDSSKDSSSFSFLTSDVSSVSLPTTSSGTGEFSQHSQAESAPASNDNPNAQEMKHHADRKHPASKDQAQTFPAASKPVKSHLGGRRGNGTDRRGGQKYVGLNLSKEDLVAASCPALADDVALGDDDEEEVGKQVVDVESLLYSAQTFATASSKESRKPNIDALSAKAVGKPVESAETHRKSSLETESTSSAKTTESSLPEDGKSGRSGSTVDRSSTTQSTSSATTESSANNNDSSNNSSGLSSSWSVVSPSSGNSSSSGSLGNSSNVKSSSSATVDPLAETEPSSLSDMTEPEELSPLVDVSSACALMSDLHLGDSVETSDSSEFLANFTPSDSKDVYRAVLMIYNPVNGAWSAQTTMAYRGPLLDTPTKGANRDTFHVQCLHQDEPLGRYVGKRYRRGRKSPDVYMQDVVCQMLAGFYVTRFNQALQHCPDDILQVQFLSAAHLQLLNADGKVFDWMNIEPFLHGSFIKLTNNLNFVSKADKNERGVEVATALSHFSYVETGGTLMIVDMQGWMPAGGKGVVYLTDPVFHTLNMREFSSGDRRKEGMDAFWANQHPACNRICRYLGLDKMRPDVASRPQ